MQLNTSKTDMKKFGTPNKLKVAKNLNSVYDISFHSSLKTLGVFLDSNLIFLNHINFTKTCNYHLHVISHFRAFFTDEMASDLVQCLVLNCID